MEIMKELIELMEKSENFTIAEALYQTNKTSYDLLCVVNYILGDILRLTEFEAETESEKKDFKELVKIKNKILEIKNKNFDKLENI